MSDFKRKRIFYTEAQITTGLVTEGREWMFTDGTEYIGQYHKYVTNEVFSEPNFVKDKSRKLIPFIALVSEEGESEIIGGVPFDFSKNKIYDDIKTIDVKKSKSPQMAIINPTDEDYRRGWMTRYFAGKINDNQIMELTKDQYSKIGSEEGLPEYIWNGFKLRWKISGPLYDLIDTKTGIVKESGVIDTNQRNLKLLSEKYPNILDTLVDLTEFSA